MITIVEDQLGYDEFVDVWCNHPTIVIPIFRDIYKHPSNNNNLSFLFVRGSNQIFILPYQHTDCSSFSIDLPRSKQRKYVWDKKGFLQTKFDVDNLYDIQSYLFFNENKDKLIDFDEFSSIQHYSQKGVEDELGSVIPILKWGEYLKTKTDTIDIDNLPTEKIWIDDELLPILSKVEKLGIRVDINKYKESEYSVKNLNEDIVYSKYNPYTITSRPSNSFGGINFSAIPKKGDIRKMFIPREGNTYIQFDYDAYHVRIIGKMLKYDLPETSVHQWLAEKYGTSYDESKAITFRILYGGVPYEYKDIEFFSKVDELIQSFKNQSEIKTPKGRIIKRKWIKNPTPEKMFNYLLQSIETEFNISILLKLKERGLPLPILYVYDSVLFDMKYDEAVISDIKDTLEYYKFPVKMTTGNDYSEV